MQNLAFLLLGLSYLNPNSFLPWPNFFQDAFSILGLLIFTIYIFRKNKLLKIHKKLIYIYACVLSFLGFQFYCGLYFFYQDLYIFFIYFSLFFLSFILGLNIKEEVYKLMYFFLVIGVISVFIQILQWLDFKSIFIRDLVGFRPYANIGQPNQLATLLFFSLFSGLYLFLDGRLKMGIYWVVSIFLTFGIALTFSRTSWLVFFIIFIISIIRFRLRLYKIIIPISFIYVFQIFLLKYINIFLDINLNSLSEYREGTDPIRLKIWFQLIEVIKESPWIGYGVNQTSIAQTKLSSTYPVAIWVEYAHNIVIDIIIWFGIPFGVLILYFLTKLFLIALLKISSDKVYCIFFILNSFAVHSLLEYPFAYAYFIIPFGLFMGYIFNFFSQNFYTVKSNIILYFSFILYLILFLLALDYFKYKKFSNYYDYNYLFNKKYVIASDSYYIIDVLYYNKLNQFSDRCYLLKNYNLKYFEYVYYRFPTNFNYSLYLSKSIMENDFDGLLDKGLDEKIIFIKNKEINDCRLE
ncbi:O-antigen ligase family protein [Acinetobacter indicus]|uniref:O-antigen ligase family protein n=1 Tax=Acinetobacter indicus TaxID=756892 RepID=UPI001443B07F|nr:O-antigen ligase family protein [Acinetobacter indicus]